MGWRRGGVHVVFGIGMLAAVSACDTSEIPGYEFIESMDLLGIPDLPCPNVRVLAVGGDYTRFHFGPGRDLTDIEVEAEFSKVDYSCILVGADGAGISPQIPVTDMMIKVNLEISAWRGPAAPPILVEQIPYFVAIVDRFGKVADKRVFTAEIPFPGGVGHTPQAYKDEIQLRFPLQQMGDAFDFETVIAFQLTPEQLEYARGRVE
ncbi:MAG: hypothetical protein QF926_14230 [Alphaproteobacteria bacterium]|jgi:hypothetical protein|nr:hypothetical protein [Alphaproteobacteria bacterium]MDP6517759.1 hypothetical protein [Alphaproteobacteria bacterium]|tara:strand:+ start:11 stop:628 length:618 start_codon:yes stop_codon:yes gene_type:complete